MKRGTRPGSGAGPMLHYYEKDVTPEEKERYEMEDQLNILAHNLRSRPGYGLVQLNQSYQ